MDRIELSVFLRRYAVSLGKELEVIREGLPDELAEEREHLASILYKNEDTEKHYYTCYPILDGLIEVLSEMDKDIDLLLHGPEKKPAAGIYDSLLGKAR